MAGMRIGYALCSDNVLAESLRKTTCVFNVPVLSQYAGEAALNDTDYLTRMLDWVAEGREQIFVGLRELGLDPFPSVTNFISSTIPINGRTCLQAMLEKGFQINAWADKGFENYIRITVGKPDDNAACLKALKEVLVENA
ncbi:MAG: aminotransferase class I/II-fold pyridoxal phosphate-dependent enzyme [Deltaproteobacteria bacterium]|nr:aminotransferase class I/II-fold pyridoxal phosphate-dependent enzyme [Deltaproteobacteria bacterium]